MSRASTTHQMKANRFSVEDRIVTEKLQFDVLCAICFTMMRNPRQCLSGHVYCGDCIEQCITDGKDCPSCRRPITNSTIGRNLYLENYCEEVLIYCRYRYQRDTENEAEPSLVEDELGCQEEVPHKELDSHERHCKFSWMQCSYGHKSECDHPVRKNQWEEHKLVCSFRPVICQFCDATFPHNILSDHEEGCSMRPSPCPNCQLVLPVKSLEEHKQLRCSQEQISCPFESHGCSHSCLRQDIAAHLSSLQCDHLALLQASHDTRLKEHEKRFEEASRHFQSEFKRLSSQLDLNRNPDYVAKWTIEKVSSAKYRCFKQSKPFTLQNFEWFLGAYLFGDNDDSQDYVSLYLFCRSCPPNQKMTLRFSLSVLNHNSKALTVSRDFLIKFPVENGCGWGDRKILRHDKLNSFYDSAGGLSVFCTINIVSVEFDL